MVEYTYLIIRKIFCSGELKMKIIARIRTKFPEKFGIPRQAGLVPGSVGKIVFEPEYRNAEALRGIEGYSHLWLIWQFSEAVREDWSPTVRPPRLGGNRRVGVFATRSPYRPNPIGLSSVRLLSKELTESDGTVLIVSGVDMLDGTPIYDIKPYLAFTDSHPEAVSGFADDVKEYKLDVVIPSEIKAALAECDIEALSEILSEDPRPSYQNDPERIYGMRYGEYEVKFRVDGERLLVMEIVK